MLIRPTPQIHRPPWGGARLSGWGKGLSGERIGESWEAGPGPGCPRLPLIKLIDVAGPLSVQVHPDDEQATRLEGPGACGKAESWLILEADPGARVALGLRRALGAEELRARAVSGEIEDDLAWHDVRPGMLIDVPPGTIHTIGPGVLLYEIQQPSDLTYRLYDWGRPRPLHLDKAMAVARREPVAWVGRCCPEGEGIAPLFRSDHYRLDRRTVSGHRRDTLRLPEAWTVIAGEVEIAAGGEPVTLIRGQTAIVAGDVLASGDAVILAAA